MPPLPLPLSPRQTRGRLGLDKYMFSGIKGGSLLMITQVFKGNFRLAPQGTAPALRSACRNWVTTAR